MLHRLLNIPGILGLSLVMGMAAQVQAAESTQLVIKDHRFEPAEITIPANTRVKLVIHNQDASAEEFESHALHREKVIPGGSKRTIVIGPLKPGKYEFEGEYNPKTAKGHIIVK